MQRPRGLFILDPETFPAIYGPDEQSEIRTRVELLHPSPLSRESLWNHRPLLAETELLFSGWGGPRLDAEFLHAAPNLKAVFYGAGAAGYMLTDEVWNRGILFTSAYTANAVPVAEYCLGMILLSLKHGWRLARATRDSRSFVPRTGVPGAFGSKIGLVSLGATARALCRHLQHFDLEILAHDPFVSPREASLFNAALLPLDQLFKTADIISLHTPLLPETTHLITGPLIASMKPGATLINTARGEIISEPELLQVAAARPDLQFILDVTDPEPPRPDSPLFDLPNILLTPHIAGSVGHECRRMGRCMVEELHRFLDGKPLHFAVSPELAAHSCHRPLSSPRRHGPSAIGAVNTYRPLPTSTTVSSPS